jgi:HSP20 family protein
MRVRFQEGKAIMTKHGDKIRSLTPQILLHLLSTKESIHLTTLTGAVRPAHMGDGTMGDVVVQKSESLWDQIRRMEERVTNRAHEIFLSNGSIFGRELDDWFRAEKELVWKPPVELREKDNHYELQAAVPGMDPRDLKIDVTPEELLIRGETRTERKEEKGDVCYSEFQSGSLFRSIRFPKRVDPNKVKAEIKNGLLTVTAPLAEEAKARRVEIPGAA